jgi:hypothetical protein
LVAETERHLLLTISRKHMAARTLQLLSYKHTVHVYVGGVVAVLAIEAAFTGVPIVTGVVEGNLAAVCSRGSCSLGLFKNAAVTSPPTLVMPIFGGSPLFTNSYNPIPG